MRKLLTSVTLASVALVGLSACSADQEEKAVPPTPDPHPHGLRDSHP